MIKKGTSISYKKEFYTSILKNGRKMQSSDGAMDNVIMFMASRNAEIIQN